MSPVSLSISYLFLEPLLISTITLISSGTFFPIETSCQRFIIVFSLKVKSLKVRGLFCRCFRFCSGCLHRKFLRFFNSRSFLYRYFAVGSCLSDYLASTANDVELPAGELCRKTYVLTTATDSKRLLVGSNSYGRLVICLVKHH